MLLSSGLVLFGLILHTHFDKCTKKKRVREKQVGFKTQGSAAMPG